MAQPSYHFVYQGSTYIMNSMGSDFYPLKTQHRPHQFLRHSFTLGLSVLFAFPKAGATSVPLSWGSSIRLAYRFLLPSFPLH